MGTQRGLIQFVALQKVVSYLLDTPGSLDTPPTPSGFPPRGSRKLLLQPLLARPYLPRRPSHRLSGCGDLSVRWSEHLSIAGRTVRASHLQGQMLLERLWLLPR